MGSHSLEDSTWTVPDGDSSSWSPRGQDNTVGDNPSDVGNLLRLVKSLRDERILVPSRQFLRAVKAGADAPQSPRQHWTHSGSSCVGSQHGKRQVPEKNKPRLLARLIDDLLEFCTVKLLDGRHPPASKERRWNKLPGNGGKSGRVERSAAGSTKDCNTLVADDLSPKTWMSGSSTVSPDGTPTAGSAAKAAAATRARANTTDVDAILARCGETYSRLLLAYPDSAAARSSMRLRHKRRPVKAAVLQSSDESSGADDFDALGMGWSFHMTQSRFADRELGGATPFDQAGGVRSAGMQGTSTLLGGSSEGEVSQCHAKKVAAKRTPFFEAVYALVSRAVQQGIRAAAERRGLLQKRGGLAQLNARVEEELACLFRSKELGRGNSSTRKGGAKLDGLGGGGEVESGKLVARAEDKLTKLIKAHSQVSARLNQDVLQLEEKIPCHAAEDEHSEKESEAEKLAGGIAGGAESKDHLATGGGDHGTMESVDALIAGFKSRALPRQHRARQAIVLQHVVGTRSPIMDSLLPSPSQQKSFLAQRKAGSYGGAKNAWTAGDVAARKTNNDPRAPHSLHDCWTPRDDVATLCHYAERSQSATPTSFTNRWALTRGRVFHRPEKRFVGALAVTVTPSP